MTWSRRAGAHARAHAEAGQQPAIRILHIGKFYPPDRGGMETYLADLMQQQRGSGVDARALVHGQPRGDDPPWLERLPVQIRLIFTPIALGFPWAMRRSLKTFAPDVLHLHMPNVAVFWLLLSRRARRIPWVVHWHSDVTFSREQTALALAYRVYAPFERAVLAQARFIIATSPPYLQASETLQAWRSKCVAIPLGLQRLVAAEPVGTPQPAAPPRQAAMADVARTDAQALAALPWLPGKLRIISVGRLTYYKGFDTLVRAVAELPQVQLKIIGDGDQHAHLQALVDELRAKGKPAHIALLGGVTEAVKHHLLASSDVFALASRERTEAFGLALVEAMQFGKPCVVSDLHGSGMPWLIRESKAGLCVPMGDVAAWRGALEQLRNDAPRRMALGQAGRQAAQQLFSIQANSGQVQSLYASLVREHQPAQRKRLLAVPIRQVLSPPELDAWALRYRQLAVGDVVFINEVRSDKGFLEQLRGWSRQRGVVVIHTPWRAHRLGGLQTAMRWALRQGYASLLQVPAEVALNDALWPRLQAAIAAMVQGHDSADAGSLPDVIHAVPAGGEVFMQRAASAWFSLLTGGQITPTFVSMLQLYQRSALQTMHQMRLSMLDFPEVGLSLMARRADLRMATLPCEAVSALDVAPRWRQNRRALAFVFGGTLMYLAKWRRLARTPALPAANGLP